jgi:nicotinate-nucleotide adenylyltransferase
VAGSARTQLALDRVVLMPADVPPHKLGGEEPGAAHRLSMCRLAVAEAHGISACGLELERGGASYTVDTLEAIHAKEPQAHLTFIAGADTARTLGSWREPQRVLELAELAVATRTGSGRREVLDALGAVTALEPDRQARVRFLSMPAIEVSSSMVRERVARGEPIDELVGPSVASYIAEHRLYRARVGAAR